MTNDLERMLEELKRTVVQGYQDGQSYLADLLQLTAFKISAASLKSDAEPVISHKKLVQMEYLMGYKSSAADQGSAFPFFQLKKKFHLTAFQCHCVLTALLYEVRMDHKRIFPSGKKRETIPSARLAADSFGEAITLTRLKKELTPEFIGLFLRFQPRPSDSPFETSLFLAESIKRFLISGHSNETNPPAMGTLVSCLGADAWDTSNCRDANGCQDTDEGQDTEHRSAAQRKVIKISDRISHAYQHATFGSVLNIYGHLKSGRLYQLRRGLANRCSLISVISLKDLLSLEAYLWEYKFYEILRESLLYDTVVCITDIEAMEKEASEKSLTLIAKLFVFAKRYFPCIFLITEKPYRLTREILQGTPLAHIEVGPLSREEQFALWENYFVEEFRAVPDYLQSIVNKYNFNPGEIKEAVQKAKMLVLTKEDGFNINEDFPDGESRQTIPLPREHLLDQGCHSSCEKLQELGTHAVSGNYDWDDLILADSQKEILLHGCNHIHQSHIVYGDWRYEKLLPYGRNLNMLFEGPPGTGKTMAAQIIASNLGLELYKVDISKTVSKYIGETEENLNKIFNEAERCNAILFIDEMDAFFGKRTEIKDSHDKYANTETSFLLQKLESFRGILLLATNHMENIDEAFIRRIKFIVHFALPDEDNRRRLWQSIFPSETPLSQDVDFDFLANHFQLSGGVIKNIALKAAFLAAAQKNRVTMQHIFLSLQDELTKQGQVVLESDFGEYRYLLDS